MHILPRHVFALAAAVAPVAIPYDAYADNAYVARMAAQFTPRNVDACYNVALMGNPDDNHQVGNIKCYTHTSASPSSVGASMTREFVATSYLGYYNAPPVDLVSITAQEDLNEFKDYKINTLEETVFAEGYLLSGNETFLAMWQYEFDFNGNLSRKDEGSVTLCAPDADFGCQNNNHNVSELDAKDQAMINSLRDTGIHVLNEMIAQSGLLNQWRKDAAERQKQEQAQTQKPAQEQASQQDQGQQQSGGTSQQPQDQGQDQNAPSSSIKMDEGDIHSDGGLVPDAAAFNKVFSAENMRACLDNFKNGKLSNGDSDRYASSGDLNCRYGIAVDDLSGVSVGNATFFDSEQDGNGYYPDYNSITVTRRLSLDSNNDAINYTQNDNASIDFISGDESTRYHYTISSMGGSGPVSTTYAFTSCANQTGQKCNDKTVSSSDLDSDGQALLKARIAAARNAQSFINVPMPK